MTECQHEEITRAGYCRFCGIMPGKTPDDSRVKVSLICRACGTSLKRVLRNLDELPSCPNCRSEMLVENVIKETQ